MHGRTRDTTSKDEHIKNNFLDKKHPVFGKVTKGIDVVDKIGSTKTGPGDRPVKEIKIIKAEIKA